MNLVIPFNYSTSISNIKIAYFAGTMKPGHDGVTRVLYRMIEELNKRKVRNIFFSPIIPGETDRTTHMIEVPSITFPLYKDYKLPLPLQSQIEKSLNHFKPDIIHINSPCPLGYAAVKYGLKHNIPVVATYHTHFASYAKYYNIKALEYFGWNYLKSLYNKCDKVYVPSTPIMEELSSRGFNTIEYLPHGVDTNTFNPGFKNTNWKKELEIENKTALLFAGRLVWEKDLSTLAETYKIIMDKRNDVVFILAGDGPIRKELMLRMPKAKFLGQLSGTQLSMAYASSDIFVFPSTTETFGNVTVEAMASGIPPICAREGGAYGIIKEDINGMIAEPRNAISLSEKIEMLIDNLSLRKTMANNALVFAKTQSWENIFNRLFESYIDVINARNNSSTLTKRISKFDFPLYSPRSYA